MSPYSSSSADIAAFRAREVTRYWPDLAPAPVKSPTPAQRQNRSYRFNALGTISPDLVRLAPDNLSTMGGDFRSFLLGSGNNRWNNVALSETFARLVTGKKVEATFASRGGVTPQWPAMPAPWGGQTREGARVESDEFHPRYCKPSARTRAARLTVICTEKPANTSVCSKPAPSTKTTCV